MPDQDVAAKQAVLNALLKSGFPFQTAIAEIAPQVPRCKLIAEEFPWRDDAGTEHFLDLVLYEDNFILTIECKKTEKEIFTFLQPAELLERDYIRARCLFVNQIQDSTKRLELFCGDWDIKPKSRESQFCVVSTSDSGRDQRMLEKDARLLVQGAEAFGRYVKQKRQPTGEEPDRVILPVIVTNAKLFQATYKASDVSLETGQLPVTPAPEISPLRWIRFRKAFTSGGRDTGERTVFVIAASALQEFLHDLDRISSGPSLRGKVLIP